jgi:hypothetical protein
LGKDTTSAWTSDTQLNRLIDQAHKWAAGYHKWPFTEGRISTTLASLTTNEDSYLRGEYPEGWKSDSIRQLTIGGLRYQKLNFEDFQIYLEEQPRGTDKVYSDFARVYYVNPNTGVSGTVAAWGQYTPATLDDESATDETVFRGEDEANQAIIDEVISYLLRRDGKEQEAVNHHNLAKQTLEELWKRIGDEQFAYQTKDREMFTRVDVVNGGYYDDLDTDQF